MLRPTSVGQTCRIEAQASLLLCSEFHNGQETLQVLEAGGLQTLLALLPAPVSAGAASTAPAAAASTLAATAAAHSWVNKPASYSLQTCLLQLLAAIIQSQQARSTLLSGKGNSNVGRSSCCAVLLNILDPGPLSAPPAPLVPPPGGKGAAAGKADGKAKAAGKGKAEAVGPVAAGPPAELVPPFPVSVQLPAVQCLQVRRPLLVLILKPTCSLLSLRFCVKPKHCSVCHLRSPAASTVPWQLDAKITSGCVNCNHGHLQSGHSSPSTQLVHQQDVVSV